MRWIAKWDYRADFKNRKVILSKGDAVEDAELAEFVNRDSPGCLKPVKGKDEHADEKSDAGEEGERGLLESLKDRMLHGASNRDATEDPHAGEITREVFKATMHDKPTRGPNIQDVPEEE